MSKPTDKQVAALQYLIARTQLRDKHNAIASLAKQLLWKMIQASENMTKPVCTTLHVNDKELIAEEIYLISDAVDLMCSGNGNTHLGAMMHLMGVGYLFSLSHGNLNEEGRINRLPSGHPEKGLMCYSFWLGPGFHGKAGGFEKIKVTCAELEAIDLSRSGLYRPIEQG
jgi:hypothetical protein